MYTKIYYILEAHTVTLLTLYSLYFQKFLQLQPDEEAFLKDTSARLGEAYKDHINLDPESRHNLSNAVTKTIKMFESRHIFKKSNNLKALETRFTVTSATT